MPTGRQRTGLGFTVADNAADDQVRVVEGGAESVRERVAKLAALVDRPRRLGRDMARYAAGKRELGEEPLHPLLVLRDVRVHFAIGSLEIGVRDQGRPAMPRPGNIDHVQPMLFDEAVQVDIDEVQTRGGSPMAEEPRFDVLLGQRLSEQRVVLEIDLTHREIVCRSPVGVGQSEFMVRQHVRHCPPTVFAPRETPEAKSNTPDPWRGSSRQVASERSIVPQYDF